MADRVYTIPLRASWVVHPRISRVNRSVNVIRAYLERHAKVDEVKLSAGINEYLWISGAKKPPGAIKVVVSVKEGIAHARLPEEKVALPEKKGKTEKAAKDEAKAPAAAMAPATTAAPVKPATTTEKKPATSTPPKPEKGKKLTPEEEAAQLWKETEQKVAEKGEQKS
ncbi:MAG: hypothetical protein HY369_00910 [Candidatus Aenigmarchaeota archaeon]|nr:hypothetical protein [Candidatus Aenigmarchaeota archaeon]